MKKIKQIKKIIIIINLIILFSLNSNVFALTAPNTIEAEDIENIIDYIYSVQDDIYSSVDVETRKGTINSIKQNVVYSNVANTWNTYINTTSMPYMENITITFKVDTNYLYIYMTPSNNTIGDIAPFPKVQEIYGNDYNTILLSYINSNGERISVIGNYIRIDKNGTIAYSDNYRPSDIATYLYENISIDATNSTCYIPFILGLNTNTKIYFQQGDKSSFSWYINENKINTVNRVVPEVPEEPENPEQPTTSGDYGGILDNISGGISDINKNLENLENTIASGNQEILDNMLNSGDLGIVLGNVNLSGDEWIEEESNGFIGSILKGIYGVFNKIWRLLFEVDNKKVTKLINNFNEVLEANSNMLALPLYLITSTMNTFIEYEEEDFIISWNAINYQNIDIIPAGSINFNQIVNNNEKFKEIYDLAIMIESVAMIFLFASWLRNMFLDLLGINWLGHQSEEPQDKDIIIENNVINTKTGEYAKTKTFEHREGKTGNIIRTIYKGGK